VKIRGELALRNVRELHQPGLEALQREQGMPRGGVCVGSQGVLKCSHIPLFNHQLARYVRDVVQMAHALYDGQMDAATSHRSKGCCRGVVWPVANSLSPQRCSASGWICWTNLETESLQSAEER
jgi:hypothetical protein